jgi:RNA polymerase sigma factor (sigma-70 family)
VNGPGPEAPRLPAAGFESLVRAHQSRVRQQLRRLTRGDRALADDLAQDTFIQAWRHLAGFRGEARVSTWLHRIAYNVYLGHCRGQREWPSVDASADLAQLASPDFSHASARRLDVDHALALLPDNERVALIHCYQLDLSHAEAADVLGWPLGTLKSHVARGKARLRERLEAWNPQRKEKPR